MIDSGCTSTTVSGIIWLESFIDSFSDSEKVLVKTLPCTKKYKFGDGNEIHALKKVVLPVFFGKKKVSLSIDIVPVNIPLLLSKESLKKGNSKIDFEKKQFVDFR